MVRKLSMLYRVTDLPDEPINQFIWQISFISKQILHFDTLHMFVILFSAIKEKDCIQKQNQKIL